MLEYTIQRNNKRPLVFTGTVLAFVTTKERDSTRWVECRVYESSGAKFVAETAARTQWQGEKDIKTGNVFETKDALVAFLEDAYPSVAAEISTALGVSETL